MRSKATFDSGLLGCALCLLSAFARSSAFDISRPNNLVAYWGANSHEDRMSAYCDGSVDAIVIEDLAYQPDSQALPTMSLKTPVCGNAKFPNSSLTECPELEADILECQSRGVAILIDLWWSGDAPNGWAHSSESARTVAHALWDLILGGDSSTRPFGHVPLDGVVIEVLSTQSTGLFALVDQLHSLSEGDAKRYFWAASTLCGFADSLAGFDSVFSMLTMIFVNVATSDCSLDHYDNKTQWNYGVWDDWASRQPARTDFKLYFSVMAFGVAGIYTSFTPSRLAQFASDTMTQYPRYFGGILYNDAAYAASNDGFNVQLRKALSTLDFSPTSSSSSTSILWSSSSSTISSGPVAGQNPLPSDGSESHSSHTKLIIGITIPVLVIACAIVTTLAFLRMRRRRARRGDEILGDSTGELIAPYLSSQDDTPDPRVPPVKWVERKSNSPSLPGIPRDTLDEAVQPVNAMQAQPPMLQNLEGLAALETEIGRVGLTVPALLASLGRLGSPANGINGDSTSEMATEPPEYS